MENYLIPIIALTLIVTAVAYIMVQLSKKQTPNRVHVSDKEPIREENQNTPDDYDNIIEQAHRALTGGGSIHRDILKHPVDGTLPYREKYNPETHDPNKIVERKPIITQEDFNFEEIKPHLNQNTPATATNQLNINQTQKPIDHPENETFENLTHLLATNTYTPTSTAQLHLIAALKTTDVTQQLNHLLTWAENPTPLENKTNTWAQKQPLTIILDEWGSRTTHTYTYDHALLAASIYHTISNNTQKAQQLIDQTTNKNIQATSHLLNNQPTENQTILDDTNPDTQTYINWCTTRHLPENDSHIIWEKLQHINTPTNTNPKFYYATEAWHQTLYTKAYGAYHQGQGQHINPILKEIDPHNTGRAKETFARMIGKTNTKKPSTGTTHPS